MIQRSKIEMGHEGRVSARSVALSQYWHVADWIAAPVLCCSMQWTTNLKTFASSGFAATSSSLVEASCCG